MQETKQQLVQPATDAPRPDRGRAVRQRQENEGPFADEGSLLEAQPAPGGRVLAEGETGDEDPIEPALEDRRHAVPPERELQHGRVGITHLLLLAARIRRLASFEECLPLMVGDV